MANELNNLQRNSKAYWSLLKCFLNNKKIPLIPPLFHENKLVTNFLEKAELFNSFFLKQCSLINNGSNLPTHIQYLTNNCLSSVTFSQDDIAKIIQNLDPGKAHGHNNISIRMLKFCGSPLKCRAHLMSRKILRDLLDIFHAQHLVFHHCATLNERDFFFKRNFFLHSFINSYL